jgi:hypothetical protein
MPDAKAKKIAKDKLMANKNGLLSQKQKPQPRA